MSGHAQDAATTSDLPGTDAQTPVAPASPAPLEPFIATYEVYHHGRHLGTATMQLAQTAPSQAQWRIDLTLRGGGLARLTGLNIQQSTVFDAYHNRYRPLSQSTVKRAFLASRKTTGIYDWHDRQAQWQGDVKDSRSAPIALQPGDMSGLLINLAVIRDAQASDTLQYRFVDDGRASTHVYRVAAQPESIQAGDMRYDALQVARTQDDGDATVLWVANGVPTPIRILQRDKGEDATDLRLIEYH